MKRIFGLDLGTASIGWAVVTRRSDNDNPGEAAECINGSGSRIIPDDRQGDFEKGNPVSQTSERTGYRGVRRLRQRHLLRRERLNRVLDVMGFLPEHYSQALTRYGKFKDADGCKPAWRRDAGGKYDFIFKDSFAEMLADIRHEHPGALSDGTLVPYDWTIYYLRKKALTQAVSRQELAWILLNFNQKRGYYQMRGEEQEDNGRQEEFLALKVTAVEDTGERRGRDTWYNVILENGMIYRRTAPSAPGWTGSVKEFIVTTQLDKDGKPKKDKDGRVKYSLRMPDADDWTLIKKKTESDINNSAKTVGEYIYDALKSNPRQKIRGRLVRTIERKYYRQELVRILDAQKAFIPELNDNKLLEACLDELYPVNDAYRSSIRERGFTCLLADNIIFYRRPLKSKNSLIGGCPYESHKFVDKRTGEAKTVPVKCVAKSNPLYQELRLWQFVSNLRIYRRLKNVGGRLLTDVDVTAELLPTGEDRAALFGWLNDRLNISQDTLLGTYFKMKKTGGKSASYPCRWNYPEYKTYPCNETRGLMLKYLKRADISSDFLSAEREKSLWHILYSVEDKGELSRALVTFAVKHGIDNPQRFAEVFTEFPSFKKEYGSYSEKAIKRLLPLMRTGRYWSESAIDESTRRRIDNIINGEYDETIKKRVREKAIHLTDAGMFRELPLWLACYVVYDRHSEAKDVTRWTSSDDIDIYLSHFRQHSLHNPIVEQVVTETLRTVRDMWRHYGRPDEIHIEMGREMKQTAEQRKKTVRRISENEVANMRAKVLLTEFMNPEFGIDNVRPYSPGQQELLRIYENGVLSRVGEVSDDIREIIMKLGEADVKKRPSQKEVMRYKLWLDQKYRSPYTGRMIPLSRLFTSDYQIEHIIPQSRYFDDSFSNKVICESAVNSLKDRMLGMEFIRAKHGQVVELGSGRTATILGVDEYERLVTCDYKNVPAKMKRLLMDDIPDDFIARQLNDSRYISKIVKTLMSNVVREEGEIEDISKHVITCNGAITDRLKHDWGVKDVWNRIILPRFRRLNELTGTDKFTAVSAGGHEIPDMPLELQKGFNKKRIDHRHHAMDAIVIACTTREHVNLLNNESATRNGNANRYMLSRKLRTYEQVEIVKNGERKTISVAKEFIKPWPSFTTDVEKALKGIVVSFKQNLRVINKTVNYYQHFENGKKIAVKQVKGDNWAIRKPLHKETVFGEINLRVVREVKLNEALKRPKSIVDKDMKHKIVSLLGKGYDEKRIRQYFVANKDVWHDFNPSKIKVYYFTQEILDKNGNVKDRYFATRESLDTSFDSKKIKNKVADTGIRKILLRHLEACGGDVEKAFSPDGIETMNRNMLNLNNGKAHQPIYKVRVYEKAVKYAVGRRGNKALKFVEAAKGTNLYFAVYETEVIDNVTGQLKKKRSYATIPLYEAVNRAKAGQPVAPNDENGNKPAFVLSPNDLVYLPTKEEIESGIVKMPLDKERIYKMVDASGICINFVPQSMANVIYSLPRDLASIFCNGTMIQNEFGLGSPKSKNERAITGEMIKEICIPIKVDRIGNIIEINGEKV